MRGTSNQRAIIQRVADEHGFTPKDLLQKYTRGPLGHARQALMAELYATGRYSFPQLGTLLGCHHTAVIHGVRRHQERVEDVMTKARIEKARRRKERAKRDELMARLTWRYGRTRARDIIGGYDPGTKADLARWNGLGQRDEVAA